MSNTFKNFIGFACVIVGPFLIALAYSTNLTYSFVGNAIVLTGTALLLAGGVYLCIKFMRWFAN